MPLFDATGDFCLCICLCISTFFWWGFSCNDFSIATEGPIASPSEPPTIPGLWALCGGNERRPMCGLWACRSPLLRQGNGCVRRLEPEAWLKSWGASAVIICWTVCDYAERRPVDCGRTPCDGEGRICIGKIPVSWEDLAENACGGTARDWELEAYAQLAFRNFWAFCCCNGCVTTGMVSWIFGEYAGAFSEVLCLVEVGLDSELRNEDPAVNIITRVLLRLRKTSVSRNKLASPQVNLKYIECMINSRGSQSACTHNKTEGA